MRKWLTGTGELLSKAWFSVPVILTAVIGYGYGLTHEALHIDDLAIANYVEEGLILSQGRWGSWLISQALGLTAYRAGTLQLVGLLFTLLAAAGFCALLREQSDDCLQKPAYPLFACFFISFPLIATWWVYDGMALCVGVCYFLTALALVLACVWVRDGGYGYAIGSVLLMLLTLLTYESLAAVYICGVFLILLLRWLFGEEEERSLRVILLRGMKFAGILAVSAGVRLIAFPVFSAASPMACKPLLKTLFVYYGLAAKWYPPICILLCAGAALLVWGILNGIRQKKTIWLLIAGMCLSVLALPIAARTFNGYRTCQVTPFFIAAVVLLVAQDVLTRTKRQWVRVCAVSVLCLLCFRQAMHLDGWLHVDVRRYEEEKQVVTDVYRTLEREYDLDKPVEFVGLYVLSDDVMERCAATKADPVCAYALKLLGADAERFCYADSIAFSYLQYGLEAFYPGEMLPGEMIEALLRYNGLRRLRVGTEEMYVSANALGVDMPVWPAEGSIAEAETFTIVKLGDIWIPPDRAEPERMEE